MSSRTVSKGQNTRETIVERALALAVRGGLDKLTIGAVAEVMQMSKSGVFAHFGSREDLQLAVLELATRRFSDEVFVPAFRQRRGLPRLRAIISNMAQFYLQQSNAGGCVVLSASMEFDDQPGVIRDRLIAYHRQMRRELVRAVQMAVDSGELRAEADAEQLEFELFGLMLATHHHLQMFADPTAVERAMRGFDHCIERWRKPD